MASCITKQLVVTQPQFQLTVTEQSNSNTSTTYAWELKYVYSGIAAVPGDKTYSLYVDGESIYEGSFRLNDGSTRVITSGTHTMEKSNFSKTIVFSFIINWDMYWNYKKLTSQTASLEMTMPARSAYTITYDANKGTGEPTSQTKLSGEELTLSTTRPTRVGYNFLGWSKSSTATSATYSAGDKFTDDADTTLYAVWSRIMYTITYDANGGTGAPESQTKPFSVALQLTFDMPTRKNHAFVGWGTSPNSTTISYNPGAVYTLNASITLYAIWSVTYEPPYVMSLVVDRCTSDGTLADDGTYLKASFEWKTYVSVKSMQARWSETEDFSTYSSYTISHSGTDLSGTKTGIIFGGGAIDTEKVYYVRVYVTDNTDGNSYYQVLIPSMKFTVDFLAGGKGVSFGKVATKENTIDTDWDLIVGGNATLEDTTTAHLSSSSAVIAGETSTNSLEVINTATITRADIVSLYDGSNQAVRNGLCAYASSGIDPDTTLEHEIVTSTKTPNGAFMYIITYFYSGKKTNSNRMQMAFPYNKAEGPYYRYYLSGTWSKWMRIGSHIHAATEQVTGNTWTDGKPIYRRVITGSVSTLNADAVVGTIASMATVVDFHGTVKRTTGGSIFGMTYYSSSSDYHRFWVKSNGEVTGRTSTALTVNAIVDYTKTTD